MRVACYLVLALFLSQLRASAIVLFGYSNSDSLITTNPGSGLPWDSVAKLTDAAGTAVAPSAVYLGNGYMLTADHVGLTSHVTFDGTTTYAVDGSYTPVNPSPGADLKIFKLASLPPVAPVNLWNLPTAGGGNSFLVGWGVGRAPGEALHDTSVTWGDDSTATKRWGINVIKQGLIVSDGGVHTTAAWITYLGSDSGTPPGVGDIEAAATVNDSGSALFQNISGTWYLIGLTIGVELAGTSDFGNDQTSDPNGHLNAFASIGHYHAQIIAAVPESNPVFLIGAGAIGLFMLRRRR